MRAHTHTHTVPPTSPPAPLFFSLPLLLLAGDAMSRLELLTHLLYPHCLIPLLSSPAGHSFFTAQPAASCLLSSCCSARPRPWLPGQPPTAAATPGPALPCRGPRTRRRTGAPPRELSRRWPPLLPWRPPHRRSPPRTLWPSLPFPPCELLCSSQVLAVDKLPWLCCLLRTNTTFACY